MIVIITLLLFGLLLTIVVERLNAGNASGDLPEEFEGYFDSNKYKTSQDYLKENTNFKLISSVFFTIIKIVFILLGGFNLADIFARSFGFNPIITGLIFAGVLLFLFQIAEMPFSLYQTFVIEQKYGFNKATIKIFISDLLKGLLLGALFGGAVFYAVLWFFEKAGPFAWLYCWIAVAFFYLFFSFIAPVVIMPIFNKFIPLEDGQLKDAIESYAKSQNFKLKGVYKMDGSKRSTKSNAFFTGFGRFRRIVLFDTLIEKHTVDELVSVLAHEMGHYKKGHIFKSMIVSILSTGLMFYILSFFINNPGLSKAFKMDNVSVYAGIFFFAFIYAPVNMFVSVFENILSRKHEFEADEYSVKTYRKAEPMINALKKLTVNNLSNLTPHPLKVFLEYSHPPVLERIKAIRNLNFL